MKGLKKEYNFFCSQPQAMRMLLLTNMTYAFAIPIIELFIGAYIIRRSNDVSLVMVYQLAQGTGIPVTFILNNYLLRYVPVAVLYAAGMIISGLDMAVMMFLPELHMAGIAFIGFIMGLSYGFFWANRVSLALAVTNDSNRNYYYGLETFFFTVASVFMPIMSGYFIAATKKLGWLGGSVNSAYHILTAIVILLTVCASVIANRAKFTNALPARFLYLRFHRLWEKMLVLAGLKGVAQGFVIAAPVMLIMKLVGREGSVGSIQSTGALLSAVMLYFLARKTNPKHRIKIFTAGLVLFAIGAAFNMFLYNALGVIIFVSCLVFSRPLLDLAYFPIQLGVIECVANKEHRSQFTYIFSHEMGLYVGRLFGCMSFILVARFISEDAALRFALFGVALIQCLSVVVAKWIQQDPAWCESTKQELPPHVLKEPAEMVISPATLQD